MYRRLLCLNFLLLSVSLLPAMQQEQKPDQKPDEKKSAPVLSIATRLASAKTAFLKRTGNGDNAAYDVVSSTLDGWGRFQPVNTPDKADVIIEIYSLQETSGGVSASAGGGGRRGRSVGRGDSTPALIRLTVYDAKSHVALWTGSEHPKGALKKIDRENNEVEAAQRLVSKFHDDVEGKQ